MRSFVLGQGEPSHVVVACIHGDETCGWKAAQRIKQSQLKLSKAVEFILANEKAFERGKRFVDVDMNRVFPGDCASDIYEERVASELEERLKGKKVLDVHSTESREAPFAICSGINEVKHSLARSTGTDILVDMGEVGGMSEHIDVVSVELSRKSEDTVGNAESLITEFLANQDVIQKESSTSDPDIYRVYDKEPGRDFEFTAENFTKVEEGQIFAKKGDNLKRAEESFFPILMSTDGYENIIGFKAEKISLDR